MSWFGGRRTPFGVRAALVVAIALGTFPSFAGASRAAVPEQPGSAVAAEFNARKDHYLDAMAESNPIYYDHEAAVGLLMLERAERTGDNGDVARANELVLRSLGQLEASPGTNQYGILHGGAFTFIRLVLQFGAEPDLLYPETLDALVRGRYPDGSDRPQRSLLAFRDFLFAGRYDAQNMGLDVRDGTPWDPARYDQYNGTENHKLQALVTGMLLSEIYADDVVGGVPVKDDTDALDDQWHYFRDAFYRYSEEWGDERADHMTGDMMESEEDSLQYISTHLGDYWLLRDLHSDPVVRAHAEVMIDRILADWVEDLVGPLHTGATERVYEINLDEGLSYQEHVLNYLLFDNLGEPYPLHSRQLFRFGGWANVAVATSDYVPGAAGFPMVLVDIARNKGEGYVVREGRFDHNWLESDFSLGFRLGGQVSVEDMGGGFQVVAAEGGRTAGRMVTMFHGITPFAKDKPQFAPSGVQAERTALLRTVAGNDPARLWVHPDFDNVVTDGGWLFIEQHSWSDRSVFLAVGLGSGSFRQLADVEGGTVLEFANAGDVAVWEVATSDDVADFDEFQQAMLTAEFDASGTSADYVSPISGVSLHFDEDAARRQVDGRPVDWTAYEFSFSNPWGSHQTGTSTAALERDGQSVTWDWDPNGSRTYDDAPAKVVTNAA